MLLYYLLFPIGERAQHVLLLLASLSFYAWWDVRLLPLLLLSFTVNYVIGCALCRSVGQAQQRAAGALMIFGITLNLLVLGAFKYAHFIADNVDFIFSTHITLSALILPLGISFFTFEQISFLVDVRRGQSRPSGFLVYALFVSFFPRLVAGPILRYNEIAPQLTGRRDVGPLATTNLAIGLTMFFIGLLKKSLLADGVAPYATPVFAAAAAGEQVDFLAAWGGALAYTCQLYFDFSGYSDMAIGAARCFGIRFSMNFNSPYKATSMIDFWRRWHMTLSRFLRDYLYFALGGNRRGPLRRYVNLLVTMLLGGFWHGASWTFVFWGWIARPLSDDQSRVAGRRTPETISAPVRRVANGNNARVEPHVRCGGRGVVFFRSPTFGGALQMLAGMSGQNGIALPSGLAFLFTPVQPLLTRLGIGFSMGSGSQLVKTYLWVSALLGVALLFPNSQQFLAQAEPVLHPETGLAQLNAGRGFFHLRWSLSPIWAMAIALVAFLGIISITRVSEFLYWQF